MKRIALVVVLNGLSLGVGIWLVVGLYTISTLGDVRDLRDRILDS